MVRNIFKELMQLFVLVLCMVFGTCLTALMLSFASELLQATVRRRTERVMPLLQASSSDHGPSAH